MEDRKQVWLWVLGAVALIVAVIGLVIAIQAKNGNTSSDDIATAVKAQATTEIKGLQNQLQREVQAGRKAGAAATEALRQIRQQQKELHGNQAVSESDLNKLSKQVSGLANDVNNVTAQQNKLTGSVATLNNRVDHLQRQVQKQNSGGTG